MKILRVEDQTRLNWTSLLHRCRYAKAALALLMPSARGALVRP